jgi:hypothetical protein
VEVSWGRGWKCAWFSAAGRGLSELYNNTLTEGLGFERGFFSDDYAEPARDFTASK